MKSLRTQHEVCPCTLSIFYHGDHLSGCTEESWSLRDVAGETATRIVEKITPELHDPQTKSLWYKKINIIILDVMYNTIVFYIYIIMYF